MGEYVQFTPENDRARCEHVKLGTCEELMYVRHGDLVEAYQRGQLACDGDLSVYMSPSEGWLYRLPFPDEDRTDMQARAVLTYDVPFRCVQFCSVAVARNMCHRPVVVHTSARGGGYGINHRITCPNDPSWEHTCSAHCGYVLELRYQGLRVVGGTPRLVPVVACGYCGVMYSYDGQEMAELLEELRDEHPQLVERLHDGYALPAAVYREEEQCANAK